MDLDDADNRLRAGDMVTWWAIGIASFESQDLGIVLMPQLPTGAFLTAVLWSSPDGTPKVVVSNFRALRPVTGDLE